MEFGAERAPWSFVLPATPVSFAALLISFAPGGVTETSLIALSLGIAPVLVTTHHLFRIFFTVTAAGFVTVRDQRLGKGDAGP